MGRHQVWAPQLELSRGLGSWTQRGRCKSSLVHPSQDIAEPQLPLEEALLFLKPLGREPRSSGLPGCCPHCIALPRTATACYGVGVQPRV